MTVSFPAMSGGVVWTPPVRNRDKNLAPDGHQAFICGGFCGVVGRRGLVVMGCPLLRFWRAPA
jgi:hypothetical protein